MSYDVEVTEGAYADLDRLAASIAERWPEGVDLFTRGFHEALGRLESFPLACGLAYENRLIAREVRHLLFQVRRGRTYRALFVVERNRVRVLAIRAPGERPARPEDLNG